MERGPAAVSAGEASSVPGDERERTSPPCMFVIFGITGDLAARKLLPALFALDGTGRLHADTAIVGFGRSRLNDEELRLHARKSLAEAGAELGGDAWRRFAGRLHYIRGQYDDPAQIAAVAGKRNELKLTNTVFYTATPPATYTGLAGALAAAGLAAENDGAWVRLVIEKPFGHDLVSARRLNEQLSRCFAERQLYRIDHYLAKETAQNVAVLRFANTLFEPVWSNRYVDHVQLTMTESVGLEGRGSFYEDSGVIRDVFQNHLLQLIALVAMEPPSRYDARAVRNEKVKVFEAMDCIEPDEAVFGQYAAGNGMPGYREEGGVPADSRQATFAAARFEIRNWRWNGVPFFVRSGKRLERKATEITLRFRTPPHIPFDLDRELASDRLTLRLAPDEGLLVRFNAKEPGRGIELDRANMVFTYADRFARPIPDAYETLLLDVMLGDATLFMRADEVEAQWRVVAPLLEMQGAAEPHNYPAGSMGPAAAHQLLERNGRKWHRPGSG